MKDHSALPAWESVSRFQKSREIFVVKNDFWCASSCTASGNSVCVSVYMSPSAPTHYGWESYLSLAVHLSTTAGPFFCLLKPLLRGCHILFARTGTRRRPPGRGRTISAHEKPSNLLACCVKTRMCCTSGAAHTSALARPTVGVQFFCVVFVRRPRRRRRCVSDR